MKNLLGYYVFVGLELNIPPTYIYIIKVKLLILVEGDPKAAFSIATSAKSWGGG